MQVKLMGVVERAQYVAYGLAAGLLLGMVLGWLFHGFVGTLFRVLIVLAILAPFVAAVIFWQRISGRNRVENKGRDSVVVHEGRRIRDAGTIDDADTVRDADAVRDAEWRERP